MQKRHGVPVPVLHEPLLSSQVSLATKQHFVQLNQNALGLNYFPNYQDFLFQLLGKFTSMYSVDMPLICLGLFLHRREGTARRQGKEK